MTLIVNELKASPISQTVTCDNNTILSAIRPHLYCHNFATGSLKIELYDGSNALIATSETINIADIGTMGFYHGYVRFYINAFLAAGATYTMKLVSGDGYSFSESAYIGWCNGFDLHKYEMNSVPADLAKYPLDFEIWERTSV